MRCRPRCRWVWPTRSWSPPPTRRSSRTGGCRRPSWSFACAVARCRPAAARGWPSRRSPTPASRSAPRARAPSRGRSPGCGARATRSCRPPTPRACAPASRRRASRCGPAWATTRSASGPRRWTGSSPGPCGARTPGPRARPAAGARRAALETPPDGYLAGWVGNTALRGGAPLPRAVPVACLAAVVLIALVAAPAGAATTLHGRILGRPDVSGVHARVPVLLSDGAEAVITVPAKSGFRTTSTGRTSAARTRLGDVISTRVRALRGGRAAAKYLKIVRRSPAPPFGDLVALLQASSAGAQKAVDEVGRIAKAEASAPQDPGVLRLALLDLRYQLNELIRGLRAQAGGIDAVRDRVRGQARAETLDGELADTARSARTAATRLEDGVTGLDEFINSIGGLSGQPLPVGTVGTVGQVLTAALQILDGLDPQDGLPGGPALPDPLGGVPVPPVPPVLPG